MFLTHLSQVTTLFMACVCVWAVLAGRWPERLCGVGVAINWIGTALFQDRRPHHHLQPAWFALDACLFLMLAAIVVTSRRRWCLWACACALLLLLCHLTVLIDPSFTQWSYITVSYIWSLGVVVALAVGTGLEGRQPAGVVFAKFSPRGVRPSIPSARARSRS